MIPVHQDPLNVIICGVGGQGNVLVANLIGGALNSKGYLVTVGDTYGAAQRGGAVFSSIRISSRKTYGPLIPEGRAHVIVGLEPLETLRSLVKYGNARVVCITNISTVYPVGVMANGLEYPDEDELRKAIKSLSRSVWFIDAANMARSLGVEIALNVVMVGALIGSGHIPLTKNDVQEEMRKFFPASRMDLNLKAFDMGINSTKTEQERQKESGTTKKTEK